MASDFNPYVQWLGIPVAEMPLDYYGLLGLKQFEGDVGLIEQAAQKQAERVQTHLTGPAAKMAERLLGEITAARNCLVTAESKSRYDDKLRAKLAGTSPSAAVRKSIPKATPLAAPPKSAAPAKSPPAPAALPQAVVTAAPESNAPSTEFAAPSSEIATGEVSQDHARGSFLPIVIAAAVVFGIVSIGGVIYVATSGGSSDTPIATVAQPPAPPVAGSPSNAVSEPPVTPNIMPEVPVAGSTEIAPPAASPLESTPAEVPSVITPPMATPTAPLPAPVSPISETEPADVPATQPPAVETPSQPSVDETAAPAAPIDTRLAIPSPSEQAQAETDIREVFVDALNAATEPEQKLTLASDLIRQGSDPNNTPAVRFAAWQLARALTLDAGELDKALAIIESTGKLFAISTSTEKLAALNQAAEWPDAAARAKVLLAARREFDLLMSNDAYEEATEVGRTSLQIAKAAKDSAAVEAITDAAKELRTRRLAHENYLAATERLKVDPSDASAHLAAGRWLWLTKQNLAEGLEHLRLGSDASFAAAAAADRESPTDLKQQVAVADSWRELAPLETGSAREVIMKRAQHWYQLAVTTAVGLEKLRIEKHLTELSKELSTIDPAQVAGSSNPSATSPSRPLLPAMEARPEVEWKIPRANANTAFESFLGVYMYYEDERKIYPVVNLKLPQENLWTQEIQDKCRGRFEFHEIAYRGSASFVIPADGVYVLKMPRGGAKINGKDTGGEGELSIVRGIHKFAFRVNTHGQPDIVHATISLRHKETGEEVVFFNTWRDIQAYLNTPINGQRVLDVSEWRPTAEGEIRVDPKSLQITNPNFTDK